MSGFSSRQTPRSRNQKNRRNKISGDPQSLRRQVLTDPTQRMIYDLFGEEGLKTQWEVGFRLKTPQELREEFQNKARLKKEQEVENIVKPKSDVQISIDASQLFNPYDGPKHDGKAKRAP
ncbi:13121_t:CDS:2, partial [Ambispora leptoticha]